MCLPTTDQRINAFATFGMYYFCISIHMSPQALRTLSSNAYIRKQLWLQNLLRVSVIRLGNMQRQCFYYIIMISLVFLDQQLWVATLPLKRLSCYRQDVLANGWNVRSSPLRGKGRTHGSCLLQQSLREHYVV